MVGWNELACVTWRWDFVGKAMWVTSAPRGHFCVAGLSGCVLGGECDVHAGWRSIYSAGKLALILYSARPAD